jgi:tetratricopeptide (TPR) repeat protein
VIVIRKKYRRLRKKENIIVFPGTFEKLVEKGISFVELAKFEQAVESFDQAIQYEPDYPDFLGPYAVALYETKDFHRAKDIASKLLHSGTANYINSMELYLTISIQLQEYEEVEMTIGTLLDEDVIPHELLNKFTYLRELNSRLLERYTPELSEIAVESFSAAEFIEMDDMTQQHMLASLEGTDLTAMISVLVDVVQHQNLSPLVITFALTLLQQAGFSEEVTILKFGTSKTVIPADTTLPGQDPQTKNVLEIVETLLAKDPSRFDLARGIIEKYAITAFPFGWEPYSVEDVAYAYVQYIDSLFSGNELPDTPLCKLIKQIDIETDFRKV